MVKDLEKTLWAAADKLRNNMDAAEYKHIVLGLIFLKYISDSFKELYSRLSADALSNPEDKDEYLAENVFFVPPTARWEYLQYERAKLPTIGKDIDDAMDAIERDNPNLKGVLPKDYARPALDKKRLGELIDLIGNIGFNEPGQNSKDLLVDYAIMNPPFNVSDYGAESLQDSHLWKYGVPPAGNANYAWLQLVLNKLSPSGAAGIVLANGSMTSNAGGENEIRKKMILEGVVDCMVALPTQLFFNTQIPACLWFLARNRTNGKYRNRKGEILFIDARKLGVLVTRKNRAFSDEDIAKIAEAYHKWRSKEGGYEDIQGFCKSATLKEVEDNNYVLTPGRYVGTEDVEDDGVSFEEKISGITENLRVHFQQSIELQERIKENLKKVGIEI
jgi:type I restriction-modification system DNA methylase subunit